jgi:predicted nucleic-acid-binding Zn-ribbon protein
MYDHSNQICPKCGGETYQDSVDIGVGVIYGPLGCVECGWSEDSDYDLSEGQSPLDDKGGAIDQFGGYHPPGSLTALAYRMAEKQNSDD